MKFIFSFCVLFAILCSVSYSASEDMSKTKDIETVNAAAELYIVRREYSAAETVLKSLLDAGWKNARSYFLLGELFRKKKEFGSAAASYSQSISINPNLCCSYIGRGKTFESLNKTQDALNDFNYVINMFPNYSQAYDARGSLYYKQGLPDASISDFSKAIDLAPKNYSARINRAKAYIDVEDFHNASSDLEYVIESYKGAPLGEYIGDEIAWAYFYKGRLLERLSKENSDLYPQALESYKNFLKCVIPEDGDAAALYAKNVVADIDKPKDSSAVISKVYRQGEYILSVEMDFENNSPRPVRTVTINNFDLILDGTPIGRRTAVFKPKNNAFIEPFSSGKLYFLIYNYSKPFSTWRVSVFEYLPNY